MDIFECLEKELILARAKVEVITDLLVKYRPTEPVVEETAETPEYTGETQTNTSIY